MQIHEFNSYDEYLATERRGSRYRMNRKPNAIAEETGWIVDSFVELRGRFPMNIICHGARTGEEMRQFCQYSPGAIIVGTDVFATDPDVLEWDFHETKPEWRGAFDLVYSNSLDHSLKPKECLTTWMGQLKPDGILALVWTFAHTLEERPLPYPGGDCFGAALHEYIGLVKSVGVVHDLLWCPVERGNDHVVIVGGPRCAG